MVKVSASKVRASLGLNMLYTRMVLRALRKWEGLTNGGLKISVWEGIVYRTSEMHKSALVKSVHLVYSEKLLCAEKGGREEELPELFVKPVVRY